MRQYRIIRADGGELVGNTIKEVVADITDEAITTGNIYDIELSHGRNCWERKGATQWSESESKMLRLS